MDCPSLHRLRDNLSNIARSAIVSLSDTRYEQLSRASFNNWRLFSTFPFVSWESENVIQWSIWNRQNRQNINFYFNTQKVVSCTSVFSIAVPRYNVASALVAFIPSNLRMDADDEVDPVVHAAFVSFPHWTFTDAPSSCTSFVAA